jgi:hypothetical protein
MGPCIFVAGSDRGTASPRDTVAAAAKQEGSIEVGSSLRKSSLSLLWLAAAVALAVAAPAALAIQAEPTREEYVAKVDPICKRNSEANENILDGAERRVRKGQLAPAGKQFARASAALGTAVRQIVAVPKPAADTAKLTRWTGLLKSEQTHLRKIGGYLKAEKKSKAYGEGRQLEHVNRQATSTIVGFGFRYCTISKSSFH